MLVKTHLSPATGKRERCTASVHPCRFGGHEVHDTAVSSIGEFYGETQVPAPKITHAAIARAMKVELNYTGPKPTWWAQREQQVASHPDLPTTLELLDVIATPAGKVAVTWQPISHSDKDTGMILDSGMGVHSCRYYDFETGASLGYVNLAHMNAETIARSFGDDEFTQFRIRERYGSGSFGLKDYDNYDKPGSVGLTGEALVAKRREVWLKAHQADYRGYTFADGESLRASQLTKAHIPDDATVVRDLQKVAAEYELDAKEQQAYFATPFVDYSRVEGELGGKGYGSALYIYAARRLAKQGQALRGSGIQSGSAAKMWRRFSKSMPQHVKKVRLRRRGQQNTLPVLDFRG